LNEATQTANLVKSLVRTNHLSCCGYWDYGAKSEKSSGKQSLIASSVPKRQTMFNQWFKTDIFRPKNCI
jgi:hypothetical protein